MSLIEKQISTNEKILKLLNSQFGSGQIRTADILRQKQLIESNREQKYALQSRVEVLEYQLSLLLGQAPKQRVIVAGLPLPDLPPLPDTGLPANLLARRPDVQASLFRLRAADRDVAEALSDQYPRLNLSISVSTSEEEGAVDIFDDWARSFAAGLAAPLLDAGQRRAEVRRAGAVKDQRLYEHGQVMLSALKEVEDALIQENRQAAQIASIKEQIKLVEQTNERLQHDYFNGAGDYIDVLSSLINEQELQRDLKAAKLELIEFRIALYRALAGGVGLN